MTTSETKSGDTCTLERRLDALDRLLLGILPRSERIAIVGQVETRARELVTAGSDVAAGFEADSADEVLAEAVTRRAAISGTKRRSRLALSSGILGIAALALLFAMPITYLFVMMIGDELGEWVSYSLLAIHVLVVALGGLVALAMGIAGLVSLARRKGRLVGHGWAITGLCTAPLPTLVGGLLVLVTAVSLFAVQSVTVPSPVITASGYSEPSTNYQSCTSDPGVAAPAEWTPNNPLPLPVSAAPTRYGSTQECPVCPPAAYPTFNSYGPTPLSIPGEVSSAVPAKPVSSAADTATATQRGAALPSGTSPNVAAPVPVPAAPPASPSVPAANPIR